VAEPWLYVAVVTVDAQIIEIDCGKH